MAVHVLTDATIWYDGQDLTSQTNKVELTESASELDATTFGSGGWEEKVGGLKKVTAMGEGFIDYSEPDLSFFNNVGTAGKLFSVSMGGADLATAFASQQLTGTYSHGGTVGELEKFSLAMTGSTGPGLVKGVLLKPKTTVSGNTNGTSYQAGAIATGQTGYVAIHCFSAGTTADVIVESDDDTGFGSATTRFTNTITAAGGTWATALAGPITDDWWRVRTANVTGSFSIAVVFGIR